jgi:formate hydrogenlyase subunit 4
MMNSALSVAIVVVLQTILIVLVAPLWGGVVTLIKSRLQMRQGPPLLQRYRDLFKLAGKETVLTEDASPLARIAPYAILAAALVICTWTPVLTTLPGMSFAGDLVMTVALFAAMRVLLALLALEAGTTFGGMAASRHLALSALAEPALMLSVFTLAIAAQSTDLARISASVVATPDAWISPSHLLALTAMWIVVVSETGRVPVDNPVTHLELTMIHEGMLLDVSGHHLALLEWAASIRQLLLLTLVANLFLPWGIAADLAPASLAMALGAWLAKLMIFAVVVAITESVTAKMRLFRVPEFLGMAFLLALLALTSDSLLRG